MVKLSIIIPVYNVEQWLMRCLDSLFQQNMPEDEFEVIIVNDGSTDNSLDIAESFASQHENVRIVSRANGGLSAARNTGLAHTQGKYVWFVDSDDFLEPFTVKPLLEYALNHNLDVMCFNLQRYYEDGRKLTYNNPENTQNEILSGEEFIRKQHMPPAAWAALYRRNFLTDSNLRFMEGILHEDEEFTPKAYFLSKRIAYKDTVVVNYFQRIGSIMKSRQSDRRVESFLRICDSLHDFMQKNITPESIASNFFKGKLFFCFSQGLSHLAESHHHTLEQFKAKPYYPIKPPEGLSRNLKFKLFLINHFPWLYVKFLHIKKMF